MNRRLGQLQPYPFERLRTLLAGVVPAPLDPIRLSIGEPQHAAPPFLEEVFLRHLDGLSSYPLTAGSSRLRETIAAWFTRRYALESLDPSTQVLPVNGSREALFAFAQCVVDATRADALVACPNPFYQIYEGATLLAGARPVFLNQIESDGFALDLNSVTPDEWQRVQLMYVCSPGNPTGRVLRIDEWRDIFEHADRHGFVIASDECYSEIYLDDTAPPLGALAAARALGRNDYRNLLVFTSLSKRSNVPGLRSGAVAGDASLVAGFLRYRTYHGCAMGPVVQEASVAAWSDEAHVRVNRELYRRKFEAVLARVAPVLESRAPDGGFYLWVRIPPEWRDDDERFAKELVARANVTVLPGRYLAREAHGLNPGAGRVRVALVAPLENCLEAAARVVQFVGSCRPEQTGV